MNQDLGLTPALSEALTTQQKGWLMLAATKKELFDTLQKGELFVQSKLKDITQQNDLPTVQAALKEAKETAAENKERRLNFTNMLQEKLIAPSMEFEKRNDAVISEAGKHELKLRTEAWEKQQAGKAKDKEVSDYKTHIVNEYARKATSYRIALQQMISDAYKDCLTAKRPVKEIPAFLETVKKFMGEIELVKFVPFTRLLINDKEAGEIFQAIEKYDPLPDLKNALTDLDRKFEMYAEDLKHVQKAIEEEERQAQEKIQEEADQLEQTTAINNLTSQATGTIQEPGVRLKQSFKVKEENTEEWALNVMRCFLNNFSSAKELLRVKEWGNLKISQMADAVGKLYTENQKLPSTTGLEFVKVKK